MPSRAVRIAAAAAALALFSYGAFRLLFRNRTSNAPPVISTPPKQTEPILQQIKPAGESGRFNSIVDEVVSINKDIFSNPVESVKELFNKGVEAVLPTKEYKSTSPPTRRAANAPDKSAGGFIKSAFPEITARFTNKYDSIILAAADKYEIDPVVLKQLLIAESGLNPEAVNKHSQAKGIAQFMDATWADVTPPGSDVFNPGLAIPAAAKYLRWLTDNTKDLQHALAAYNFGIGNVNKGRAWPRETRQYVAKIVERSGLETN